MALSKADLRDAVGEEIGIKRAEETLPAADADLIEKRIDGVHEFLMGEGLAYWDVGDIPEAVREPMTMIVGTRCAPAFGVQYDSFAGGMQLLRQHCARRKSKAAAKAEYF